ncbi:MAG: hypothetical protein RL637_1500 [Pseudomonadota bacterium]|jgi:isoleucyl-tRNA synthetase
MDYKHTLNLPKTAFAMKANLAHSEPERLKKWTQMELYSQIRALSVGKPTFILHDGPPYANGEIHIGHAVNKILKDFIIKSKTLSGFDAPYIPGWDCHGLPIELQVEKKVGKAGVKVSATDFRKACREYAAKQVHLQKDAFIRLGILGDWENPYLTMNFKFEADIVRALGKIHANGHLHQGAKPVHWCTDCGSALAEAEVEYEDKRSPAIDVRFKVVDEQAFINCCHHIPEHQGQGELSVVIWTTTPWTLPANQAVALHPKLEYAVVQCEKDGVAQRLLIAEALLKTTMLRYDIQDYRVIAYCNGQALEHQLLQHPFYARQVPIILGEHVTTEAGTGAVHTAPGHGQEDYVVGQRYELAVDNPVGGNGVFLPNTELFAGQHVFTANPKVIEVLKQRGCLLHHEAIVHSYPHCWRHKTPIIFRATPQWFIAMEQQNLRDTALAAVKQVQWIPDWGQARIESMMVNRPDWCISRQRTWGVPIPFFIHRISGELHPQTAELTEQIALRIEQQGIDAWFSLETKELLGEEAELYQKMTDTLDVWFDSGVTHEAVLNRRDGVDFPADLYLEGSDQHRGWFQSSLLASTAMNGVAPYKAVLTHGFTVDAQGKKMSKSAGNVVAPQTVMKELGADVLRLWVAATDYRGEMHVSDEILKRTAEGYRRIRNTARFLLSNLDGFNPEMDQIAIEQMVALDRWIIDKAYLLQQEIISHYEAYQFQAIYQKILSFCSIDLGSFYLDIIKDRQYTAKTNSQARRSAQTAMYHLIEAMSRWLAPLISYTADEIWAAIPGNRAASIFLETWYQGLFALNETSELTHADWQILINVRAAVSKELEKARSANLIGSSLNAKVKIYCSAELSKNLLKLGDELRFVFITSEAQIITLPYSFELVDIPELMVDAERLKIQVLASEHAKCVRCWHQRADVGTDTDHPELCGRCVENVIGNGEIRRYA